MGVFQKTFSTVTRFHNWRIVFANPSRDIPIIVKTSSGTGTKISQFNYVDLVEALASMKNLPKVIITLTEAFGTHRPEKRQYHNATLS
jgi:hypothetical protein